MTPWLSLTILAPTRWKLRKAIKATNQVMSELRVIKHPDKTIIGRVARGFDFLGYWFSPAGLGIARKTMERMVENMRRLYEQGVPDERIEAYFQRWCRWVKGGISADMQSALVYTRIPWWSATKDFEFSARVEWSHARIRRAFGRWVLEPDFTRDKFSSLISGTVGRLPLSPPTGLRQIIRCDRRSGP